MLIYAVIYAVFGVLVTAVMCPSWDLSGVLMGAVLWPLFLIIVIWTMIDEHRAFVRLERLAIEIRLLIPKLKKKDDDWTPNRN